MGIAVTLVLGSTGRSMMHSTLKRIVKHLGDPDLYLGFLESARRVASSGGQGRGLVTAVTSSADGEGKTFVALSLAIQAAEVGDKNILLVDCNASGKRSASRILRHGTADGSDDARRRESGTGSPTRFPRLDLLSLGPGSGRPSSMVGRKLTAVIDQARSAYDVVILDTLSMSAGPRIFDMLRCTDGVLFVIQDGRLSVAQIRSYVSQIARLEVEVLGTVLNKRRYPVPGIIYDRL